MANSSFVSTSTETHLSPTLVNGWIADIVRLLSAVGSDAEISGGELTINPKAGASTFTVENESSAAADDLDTISGGESGDVILLLGTSGQVTTLKSGTGNLVLPGGRDIVLSSTYPTFFVCLGSYWAMLSSSNAETRGISVQIVDANLYVDTSSGIYSFRVPKAFGGMNLVRAYAAVDTAGTTNSTTVQVRNMTKYPSNDALSTAMSIASGSVDGVEGVVNKDYDDVSTNDLVKIYVTAYSTTKPKGLKIVLEYSTP